jgi:predicted GIY-YIG superfamily endonuclease
MAELFFAHILANQPLGVLYVGVTNNLVRRVWQHNTKVVPGFHQQAWRVCGAPLRAALRSGNRL